MNDTDPLHEENSTSAVGDAIPVKGAVTKPRSSGRGLYITAIVLGVILVLLLALYIFLSLTYKKPAPHSSIAPVPVVAQIVRR